eukprot:2920488-Amphidinium_carterae.1
MGTAFKVGVARFCSLPENYSLPLAAAFLLVPPRQHAFCMQQRMRSKRYYTQLRQKYSTFLGFCKGRSLGFRGRSCGILAVGMESNASLPSCMNLYFGTVLVKE